MARNKAKTKNADKPRPNQIKVSLSDDAMARFDAWRWANGHKRSSAAAFLIETHPALGSQSSQKATG